MKHHKSFVLAVLIGMVLLAVAVSIAQTASQQTDQKKQTRSCCAMDSCCGNGDSCAMKTGEKTDGTQSCCGDSCDMKTKHDAKNHATTGCSCCSAHNTAAATGTAQSASNQSTKHECCSADMASKMTANHDMKNMENHDMKNMKHDMKDGCCCCGESCDMDAKKTAN